MTVHGSLFTPRLLRDQACRHGAAPEAPPPDGAAGGVGAGCGRGTLLNVEGVGVLMSLVPHARHLDGPPRYTLGPNGGFVCLDPVGVVFGTPFCPSTNREVVQLAVV